MAASSFKPLGLVAVVPGTLLAWMSIPSGLVVPLLYRDGVCLAYFCLRLFYGYAHLVELVSALATALACNRLMRLATVLDHLNCLT